MPLKQKINHCKRHRRNKRLKNKAETICTVASKTKYGMMFVVNPLIYEIIRFNNDNVDWIKPSSFVGDNSDFIIVPRDVADFYNRDETEYLKGWCGIPRGVDIPFTPGSERTMYLSAKPVPPKPTVSLDI